MSLLTITLDRRSSFAAAVAIKSGSRVYGTQICAFSNVSRSCFSQKTVVGPFCSIGDEGFIGLPAHPLTRSSTSPVFHEGRNRLSVNFGTLAAIEQPVTEIGPDVWMGVGAIVLAGVELGVGSVIGAGAIVIRDVPPYGIAVDSPVTVPRTRFPQPTVDRKELTNDL